MILTSEPSLQAPKFSSETQDNMLTVTPHKTKTILIIYNMQWYSSLSVCGLLRYTHYVYNSHSEVRKRTPDVFLYDSPLYI